MLAPAPALANLRDQYEAFARERRLRIAFEQRPDASGLDVVFEELQEGPVAGIEGLSVTAFLVDHKPVEPAFGLMKDAVRAAGESRGFAVARLLTQAGLNWEEPPPPEGPDAEIVALVRDGKKLEAIKRYRELTGWPAPASSCC